jgi:DNA primase
MFSTSTIDAIHDLPIEEIIGRFVELKKAGASLKACCPIHGEKTPSFTVTRAKNIYKCFGCGSGGDAIQFVMEHEKISFAEAVKHIAQAHGIELNEQPDQRTPEQISEQETAYQLLQMAQSEYRNLLIQP